MKRGKQATRGWLGGAARCWMAAGAVVWGLSTSPVFAQMMQPTSEMVVVTHEDGGATPGLVQSPCSMLNGVEATDAMLAALQQAAKKDTLEGVRESIPEELKEAFDEAMAAPMRFHTALFPGLPLPPGGVSLSVMGSEPIAGQTQWALSNNSLAFDVTFENVMMLDIAGAAAAAGDQGFRLRPGEGAWHVTGKADRPGGRAEFTGSVIGVLSQGVPTYWLAVEKDSICPMQAPLMAGPTGGPGGAGMSGPGVLGEFGGVSFEDGPLGPSAMVQDPAGFPPLPDFNNPCWDKACLAAKIAEYGKKAREFLSAVQAALMVGRQAYDDAVFRANAIWAAAQAYRIYSQLRQLMMCAQLSWFPWVVAICIAAVLIAQQAIKWAIDAALQAAKELAKKVLDELIEGALNAFERAIYDLYNRILDDIIASCWRCPEQQPPDMPRLPPPPWH